MSQTTYDEYQRNAHTAHTRGPWREGLYRHTSGGKMAIRYCDWISDGLYGPVYLIGINTQTYRVHAVEQSPDAIEGWTYIGPPYG